MAVNAFATYCRLVVVAVVGLTAIPVALRVLGPQDYGIFAVLGGSLAFFLFINGALTAGAERHFAHALGREDDEELERWFTSSVAVHLLWGAIMAMGALLLSHWVLHHVLRLPSTRFAAAMWVYCTVLVTFVSGVVSTPFQAMLAAHEEIAFQSLIGIAGAFAFLCGIFALPHLSGDPLINYGVIYALNQLTISFASTAYALYAHPVCRRLSLRESSLATIRELVGFSFWNAFGAFAGTVRSQGPAVLMNRFYGPTINAAYGIALQVNGSVTNLSSTIYRATIPQIVKSHARGDRNRMGRLACLCSKYSFFVLWVVCAPILLNVSYIFRLWLHHPPAYVQSFFLLLAAALLIDQLTNGVIAVAQAVGDLRAFQLTTSTLLCMALPLGYLLVRLGYAPSSILWAGILAAAVNGAAQVWFGWRLGRISLTQWLRFTLFPVMAVIAATAMPLLVCRRFLLPGFIDLIVAGLLTALTCALVLWVSGSPGERAWVRSVAAGLFRRCRQLYPQTL